MSAGYLQIAAELWVVTVGRKGDRDSGWFFCFKSLGFFAAPFILRFYEVFLIAGSVCSALAVQITLLFWLPSEFLVMPLLMPFGLL